MLNKIKNFAFVAFGALMSIFAFVMWFTTRSDSGVYDYETTSGATLVERDIEFNMDYVILFIVGLAITAYAIYLLYTNLKGGYEKKYYYYTSGSIAILVSFYGIGAFFKELVSKTVKHKEFNYIANQFHLYIGIIALAFVVYIIAQYLESKKA